MICELRSVPPPEATHRLIRGIGATQLSDRERQVLRLVARGLAKQVARTLGIAERT